MSNSLKEHPHIHQLWPTFILTKKLDNHRNLNRDLIKLFYDHRETNDSSNGDAYASDDKLLQTYDGHPQLTELATFIKDNVFEIARFTNQNYWQEKDQINLILTGLWFQMTNQHHFHETHVHGNCSWSGVYYVQTGECGVADTPKNRQNGITRFYGPNFDASAGGHTDYGNIYLQDYAWNAYPEDGKLVIFPSHLKHMAFPYTGEKDRIIVSFHAQVNNESGFQFAYDMNN